jgi:biopolymer transport protein ExbB
MLLRCLFMLFVLFPTLAWAQSDGPAPDPLASAVPAPPALAPPVPAMATSVLPRDLSVWGMFMQADRLVQGVMVGLAFASVLTWTVFATKTVEIAAAGRRLRAAPATIDRAPSLADAPAGDLVAATQAEFVVPVGSDRDGIKERVGRGWSSSRLRPPVAC